MKKQIGYGFLVACLLLAMVPLQVFAVAMSSGHCNALQTFEETHFSEITIQPDDNIATDGLEAMSEKNLSRDTEPSSILTDVREATLFAASGVYESDNNGDIGNVVAQGYCGGEGDGTNLTWIFTNDGTLSISGNGVMANYDDASPPWWDYNVISNMTALVIGDGVTSIGNWAFHHFENCKDVVLPNSVITIGKEAFSRTDITSIVIPDNVSAINPCTFWSCSNLSNVTIPNNVTRIDEGAFYNCYKLTDVYFRGTLSQWNEIAINNVNNHDNDTNNYPLSFVTVHCADGEVRPSEDVIVAHGYCGAEGDGHGVQWILASNKTLTIKGIGAMEDYQTFWEAFGDYSLMQKWYDYDSYIETVIIEDGITSVGRSAFWALDNLANVIIPHSVTSFGVSAFNHCSHLTNIDLPDGVTIISDGMFASCYDLASIVIPDSVSVIDCGAFQNCDSLTTIIIPDTVTSIGEFAFRGCSSLTNITIPYGITQIEMDVFDGCSSLTNVVIPNSVTAIANSAFTNCSNLTDIAIPQGVESLEVYTFMSCSNLRSITIPRSVTLIKSAAFRWCESLTDIYYEGTQAQWNAIEIKDHNDELLNADIHYNSFESKNQIAVSMPIVGNHLIRKADLDELTEIVVPITASVDMPTEITVLIPFYDIDGRFVSVGAKTQLIDQRTAFLTVPITDNVSDSVNMQVILCTDFCPASPSSNYRIS